MATVIVPAYNESKVIRRCLDSLLLQDGVNEIIVACNGCHDNTAQIVQQEYPTVICLDIKKPSKVNALNEAEKLVNSWPVVYLDADLQLWPGAVKAALEGMHSKGYLLVSPTPIMDTSNSSWVVKQYYKTHRQLSYVDEGVIGTGTFILDKEGRARFGAFPQVINDDHFVRSQFEENELANIPDSKVTVTAPRNAWSLIKILTRSNLGNIEIDVKGLSIEKEKPSYSRIFLSRLFSRDFLSTAVYLALVITAKTRAKRQFKSLQNYRWEVDSSSRI